MAEATADAENGRVSGEIVRILSRKHDLVVGTLEYSRGYAISKARFPALARTYPADA